MNKQMKNNKGITLTSIVIYIAIMFVVLAIIMRITTYFSNNMSDVADVTAETQIEKINIYFLDEVQKIGNGVTECSDNEISFSSGNTYTFIEEEKILYLNNSIKICENLYNCTFATEIAENGKTVVIVRIAPGEKEDAKEIKYVLSGKWEIIGVQKILNPLYQEVEYIESTGTQYIDTNYIIENNNPRKIVAEFEYTQASATANCYLFGTVQTTNNNYPFAFGCTDLERNKWIFGHYGGSGNSVVFGTFDTNKHEVKYVFGEGIYIDGILQTETEKQASTISNSGVSMVIFARKRATELGLHSMVKLYSFKMYEENDVLVRDFVPCYRKADGKVGLYDNANGIFYENAGTGEFKKGPNIVENKYISENDYIFQMEEKELDDKYKRVDYIESTGTQYIDTNYICSSDEKPIKIESEFKFMQQGTGFNYLFGAFKNTGNEYPLTFGTNVSQNSWVFGHYASGKLDVGNKSVSFGIFDTNKHKVKYVFNEGIYLDGVLQEDTVAQARTSSNSGLSLILFAVRKGATITSYSCARIYSFKIYEGDNILVRDYIPCYRISDNVAGLYDMVEEKFYENAGTGDFLIPE